MLVVLCVLGSATLFYLNANQLSLWTPSITSIPLGSSPTQTVQVPAEFVEPRRTGDYELAVSTYESTINDPTKSSEEKAIATYGAAGAKFHVTGDINDRLADVQSLKKIVVDPTISLATRIASLNILAAAYADSGRDPVVFEEMYKDEPFRSYLAPGEPELSSRQLYEWSYSLKPTSLAAVRIAKWYSEQYVFNENQTEDTTKAYVALTEDYMNKATALIATEAEKDPTFYESSQYVNYLYWKAVITGRLSLQKGEPYTSQYHDTYDQYIKFAQESLNPLAKEYLFYARYNFSLRLFRANDFEATKIQLDLLAKELDALPHPDVTGFVRFLRNIYTYQRKGLNWTITEKLFTVSPNFKTTVERIIATIPPSAAGTAGQPVIDNY